MGTALIDRFQRANGAIGNAESGQAWATVEGTVLSITSHAVHGTAAGGNQLTVADVGSAVASVWADVFFSNANGVNDGLIVACNPTGPDLLALNFWHDNTDASTGFSLYKGDLATGLASGGAGITPRDNSTHRVGLTFDGVVLKGWFDGIVKVSYTLTGGEQTTYNGAAHHSAGVFAFCSSPAWDGGAVSFTNIGILTPQGTYGVRY